MTSHFTPEQLQELEVRYGLTPVVEMLPVRDGQVAINGICWWRGESVPERVDLSTKAGQSHLTNLREYPECYQLKQPVTKLTYLD